MLVSGGILRAAVLPWPGTIDVQDWKIWSFAASTDMSSMYGVGGQPPIRRLMHWLDVSTTTDYPPLALEQLMVVGRVYRAIDPDFANTPTLSALVKLPGILAELLLLIVVLTWGRRRFGERAAFWTAAAIWLNPAIWLDGAVLGYLDAQMAVPAVLSVLAIGAGAWPLAGALLAAAVLTKVQAVVIVPVLVVSVLRKSSRPVADGMLFVAGGIIVTAIAILPFAARGALPNMVQAIASLARHNMISGYGLNIWWVLTWIVRSIDSLDLGWWRAFTLEVSILQISDWARLYPDPRPLSTALTVVSLGWAAWRACASRSLSEIAALSAWSVYAYSMFNIPVHENHLYLAVPMLAIAAATERRLRPVLYAVSGVVAVNLYLFYGLGEGRHSLIDRSWTTIDLSVPLSLVNIGIFVWTTRAVMMGKRLAQEPATAS